MRVPGLRQQNQDAPGGRVPTTIRLSSRRACGCSQWHLVMAMRRAFTLIELLVVLTIISILSTIAVPNFLDAEIRAKVSAARNNMRVLAHNIELYQVDYNKYPAGFTTFFEGLNVGNGGLGWPDYPGSYANIIIGDVILPPQGSSIQRLDPFRARPLPSWGSAGGLVYFNHHFMNELLAAGGQWDNSEPENWKAAKELAGEWSMHSIGPAQIGYFIGHIAGPGFDIAIHDGFGTSANSEKRLFREYDPTNGTVSEGYIFRTQKNPGGLGVDPRFYTED